MSPAGKIWFRSLTPMQGAAPDAEEMVDQVVQVTEEMVVAEEVMVAEVLQRAEGDEH